jgi:hypothetical protein
MVGNFVDFVLMSKYASRDWKGAIFTRFPGAVCLAAAGDGDASHTGKRASAECAWEEEDLSRQGQ